MNLIDYSVIGLYLIGLLYLGIAFKPPKTKNAYFLSGRDLDWKPLSLSILATQLSAVSFISAPAFVGLREGGGLIWLSYELALPLAMLFLLWKVLPTLHSAGVVSVYDFIEQRFSLSTRLLLSLVFQISRSFATAIMIYAVAVILQGTMGLAFWQSILAIGVVTIVYSLQGGMKAVVYGDAIQMILIVLGALLCLGFGLYHLGGLDALFNAVEPMRLQAVDFTSYGITNDGFGFLPMLFGGFVLYASYYGCDQSEAQRALSAKSTVQLRKVVVGASLMRFPITLVYCCSGLVIGTLALTTPEFLAQIPEDNVDWMMPIFMVNYLPNGVLGLLLVAIFAAAMSSLSSAINSLSAVSVEDYCRLRDLCTDDKQYMSLAKLAGVFWGGLTLLISFWVGDIAPTIIEAINKLGSVFYGPILACFVLGVMTQRIAALHMNVGILCGVLSNLVVAIWVTNVFWFWWNLIGFTLAIIVALLLSRTFPCSKSMGDKASQHTINGLNSLSVGLLVGWFAIIVVICILIPSLVA